MAKDKTKEPTAGSLTGLSPSSSAVNRDVQAASALAQEPGATLTTNQGLRISDNQNSLRGGMRGPTLLEDHILR
jgi:catalase